MPEVESREGAHTIDQVMADYDRRKDHLTDLSNSTELLIKTILKEEKISFQSVQARVKKRDKVKSKYCKPEKDYKSLDEIPDVVGLRIITYYSDKIDQIAEVIGREFTHCGPREDKRIGKLDSFGYSAIHMDCMHLPKRLESTEYRRFSNARFEIQITTILGHAWAEMQHPWYDELNSPTEELRRFHRLAAVLELAEQEFLEIRKKKDDRERIASVRVAANAPEVPVTQESLKAFIDQDNIVNFDAQVASALVGEGATPASSNLSTLSKLTNAAGIDTIQKLEDKLKICHDATIEFVKRSKPIWEAARMKAPRNYVAGICIIHLSYLLIAASGVDRYESTLEAAGIKSNPNLNREEISKAARDVLQEFHIVS